MTSAEIEPIFYYNMAVKGINGLLLAGSNPLLARREHVARGHKLRAEPTLPPANVMDAYYLLPFARLCVLHNIWQFLMSVAPPLLQADTWSASISDKLQILCLLAS